MTDHLRDRLVAAVGDHYLIEAELGRGGMAAVYQALDLRLNRRVAIKVLPPDLAFNPSVRSRFLREAQMAAALTHPNIVPIYTVDEVEGVVFFVMALVDGESVSARLRREGSLPVEEVRTIVSQVADALDFAHRQGVVHRDIKPDNILLSGKHALVADFGVAKALAAAKRGERPEGDSPKDLSAALTTLGVALGTPAYMAPEQAAADPHLDHRVDVYALGVLAYELLVGEPPFVRRAMQQVIAAHMVEPAPRVIERRPATPPALDALVAKCLEKQPGDRWQSAEEIVAELERLSTPSGTAPMTAAAITAGPSAMRSRRGLAIGALTLLVLAIGGWYALARPRRTSTADQNTVVVLPFEFNAPAELTYLREGIVNILESSLTGEGGPRAVASQTTIARWRRAGGERGLTEEEARAIARALGAGQLLRGSIVGTPSNLILSATLVSTTGNGADVKTTVNGPADSIAALGARLAAQLLSLRLGESAERLPSLASVPPEALRAYLVGQGALRGGQYADAVQSFSRALALDSTFALAAFAHAVATGWDLATYGTSQGAEIAFRHRDRLSARDRTLLEMWSPSRFAGHVLSGREVIAVRERLVQQIPDRPEAWYLIGDSYLHYGRAYGFTFDESRARAENALRRALALDPGIKYIRYHIADLTLFSVDDQARLPSIADSLGISEPHYALASAIIRGDSDGVRRIRATFPTVDGGELLMSSWMTIMLGAPAIGDTADRIALDRPGDLVARRSTAHWVRSSRWLQGRPRAAARLTERLEQLDDASAPDLETVYGAIFDDGDSTQARATVARFEQQLRDPSRPLSLAARRSALWADGLWAAVLADSAGVSRSARALDSIATSRDTTGNAALTRLWADALRLAVPNRVPDRAVVDRVDAMLHDGPLIGSDTRGAMNLIVARSLERLGDNKRAALAATRVSPGDVTFVTQGPAMRDQGRMRLASGDTAAAIDAWRTYLAWRAGAEGPQRKADDEIRRKLDALQRARR